MNKTKAFFVYSFVYETIDFIIDIIRLVSYSFNNSSTFKEISRGSGGIFKEPIQKANKFK